RTRILLVEMPRMLCDIVADVLSAEPDMEVVGVLSSRGKLRATVAETRADVVVLALGDSRLPKDCERLLRAHPRLRVLGVTSEGRRGFLFGLRSLKRSRGALASEHVVQVDHDGLGWRRSSCSRCSRRRKHGSVSRTCCSRGGTSSG